MQISTLFLQVHFLFSGLISYAKIKNNKRLAEAAKT